MIARFWRYALVLVFVYCNSSVAAVHVPLKLEFHHYDPETVQLLNAAQYNSVNTETNLLLFPKQLA
ncbi:MAG: hypothetical protein K2W88_18785 [Pararheinheimera sp.]|nr:hypothetical protein [Rheinheimera sp.]